MIHRPSQLRGRARLRGLKPETAEAARELEHERHRFAELKGAAPVVVSAHQLFPTPPELAARVVELADISPGHRVLEPSAGTGNLMKAIGPAPDKVAVEIDPDLVRVLACGGAGSGSHIIEGDFLECGEELGRFDRVVMNPPFTRGSDVRHITHARGFLKPGGRLVALCANGPRQRAKLMPEASQWIDLPPGSFKSEGTNVAAAIVIFDA